jgi:hypothetical protein
MVPKGSPSRTCSTTVWSQKTASVGRVRLLFGPKKQPQSDMVDYCRVPKISPSRTWSTTVWFQKAAPVGRGRLLYGSKMRPQSDVIDCCRVPKSGPSRTWSTAVGSENTAPVGCCRVPKILSPAMPERKLQVDIWVFFFIRQGAATRKSRSKMPVFIY